MTQERYSTIAISLHWLIAVLIVANLIIGIDFPDPLPGQRFSPKPLLWLHISIGVTILLLSVLRLGWRFWRPPPPYRPEMASWEQRLARVAHAAFYVLMIGIPLSGWLVISAHKIFPFKTMVWGIVEWPMLPLFGSLDAAQVEAWHQRAVLLHTILSEYMFFALLALHIGAVLKHHLFDSDPVLERMLPSRRPWSSAADTIDVHDLEGIEK
jgi:cytochrome b561